MPYGSAQWDGQAAQEKEIIFTVFFGIGVGEQEDAAVVTTQSSQHYEIVEDLVAAWNIKGNDSEASNLSADILKFYHASRHVTHMTVKVGDDDPIDLFVGRTESFNGLRCTRLDNEN